MKKEPTFSGLSKVPPPISGPLYKGLVGMLSALGAGDTIRTLRKRGAARRAAVRVVPRAAGGRGRRDPRVIERAHHREGMNRADKADRIVSRRDKPVPGI